MSKNSKANDEREIKGINPVGKRIKWCREMLGLSMYRVARDNGINPSTYCERENGMRAICHEEYLALAQYFNSLWRNRFEESAPEYDGTPIVKVKVIWILYGLMEE